MRKHICSAIHVQYYNNVICHLSLPYEATFKTCRQSTLYKEWLSNTAGLLQIGGNHNIPHMISPRVVLQCKQPALVKAVWQVVLPSAAFPHTSQVHDWPS